MTAPSIKHKFQSALADGGDNSLLQPSNWNDDHDLTVSAASILGKTSGAGAVEELDAASVKTFLAPVAADVAFTDTALVLGRKSAGAGAGEEMTATDIANLLADIVCPIGTILHWVGDAVPSRHLLLNGQAVSRATYSALFALWGTRFGAGDGSTTFNVMDARGYVLRGLDRSAGVDPDAASRTDRGDGTTGDNLGTKQADELASHNHTASTSSNGGHTHTWGNFISNDSATGAAQKVNGNGADGVTSYNGAHTHTVTVDANGGNETRMKNIAVDFIVRAL